MFTSGERTFAIFDLFFIIILLLAIAQIIISVILRSQVNSKLEDFKYSIKEVKDIPISSVDSIVFTKNKTNNEYNPNTPNLGLAGELILVCYSGYCTEKITETRNNSECSKDDDIEDCEDEFNEYKYEKDIIDYKCSFQCFESKENECNNCFSSQNYISLKGRCSRNTNDIYNKEKYCLSNNVIYFWKGEKYDPEGINRGYTYLKNAKLKNEECPKGYTKNCGIIDDNENKLCISNNLECPINIISEKKINNSNSYFKVGNKTFYYDFDENSKNKKIIAGLYVDTDIYLNIEEEDYIILDTYTISRLLEENKILYKDVNLGFDPYTDKNIDQKGKSYLKIKYNAKNVDLISLREKNNTYFKNKNIQDNLISPVTKKYKTFNMLGIIGYSFFIFIIVILMLISCCDKLNEDEEGKNYKILINQRNFLCCFIPLSIIFVIITIFPTIKYFSISGKLNEINKDLNISFLKLCNKIFIILSFSLYGIILLFIVIICIYRKKKKDLSNKGTEKKDENNNTTNNNTTINNTTNNSNTPGKLDV